MKIAISAESAIDLPKEYLEKYDIKTTPFSVLLGEELMQDGEIDIKEIFNFVDKTKVLPKTSAVNEHQFIQHFENLLKSYDAVIHFSLSSLASCAYSNALSASKKLKNVFVVDTLSLSTGIALLAIKAKKMVNSGKSLEQILEQIKQDVPKMQVSLIVDKLDYLKKGGRCSSLVCFGANLLKIHPQILLKNGKLSPAKKYRGNYEKCIESYVNDTLAEFNNYDKDIAFIMHTSVSESVLASAQKSLKDVGFKEIVVSPVGATIACHAGPNALGVIYLTK